MTSGRQIGRRTVEVFTGFIAWKIYDYLFDYVLYPVVIWKFGPWRGGPLMASLSFFFCLVLLLFFASPRGQTEYASSRCRDSTLNRSSSTLLLVSCSTRALLSRAINFKVSCNSASNSYNETT